MKTYQQMAQAVFSARDAYLRKKQRQKVLFFRYAPVMASFGFAVLIGLHPWQNRQNFPAVSSVMEETTISETVTEPSPPESVPVIMTEARISETVPEIQSEPSEEMHTETVQISTEIQTAVTQSATQPVQTVSEPVTEVPDGLSEMIPETIPESVVIPTESETETILPVTEFPESIVIPTEAETETISPVSESAPEIPETSGNEITEQPESVAFSFPKIILHLAKNNAGNDEDAVFCLTGEIISPELVGEWFDTVDITVRYPDGSVRVAEAIGNAYLVKGMPYGTAAAVQFDGEENYYLFRSQDISEEEFQNLFSGIEDEI